MSDVQVSLVPREHVPYVWPQVEGFVEKALHYAQGKYLLEDVYALVTDFNYPLWVAFDDEGVKGAVITRFVEYPRKKYLFLEFCGGRDGFTWKAPMLRVLRAWAKDHDCDGIEGVGRDGWQKIFESDGYVPTLRHFELGV